MGPPLGGSLRPFPPAAAVPNETKLECACACVHNHHPQGIKPCFRSLSKQGVSSPRVSHPRTFSAACTLLLRDTHNGTTVAMVNISESNEISDKTGSFGHSNTGRKAGTVCPCWMSRDGSTGDPARSPRPSLRGAGWVSPRNDFAPFGAGEVYNHTHAHTHATHANTRSTTPVAMPGGIIPSNTPLHCRVLFHTVSPKIVCMGRTSSFVQQSRSLHFTFSIESGLPNPNTRRSPWGRFLHRTKCTRSPLPKNFTGGENQKINK